MTDDVFECPHCSSLIPGSASVCPECGNNLSAAPVILAAIVVAVVSGFVALFWYPALGGVALALVVGGHALLQSLGVGS